MKSYDAIGLMKQMTEQTAATISNAREVLVGDYCESSPKTILFADQDSTRKNNNFHHNEQENIPPNVLVSDFYDEAVCLFSLKNVPESYM